MPLYQIVDWDANFETSETRKLKHLVWVRLPLKADGDGYSELVRDHTNGAAHFGAWTAVVKLAARCHPRGTLTRDTGAPHDSASISRCTGICREILDEAIPRFLKIRWLKEIPVSPDTSGEGGRNLPKSPARVEESRGEESRGEEKKPAAVAAPSSAVQEFSLAWNGLGEPFARIVQFGADRNKALMTRLRDPWWRDNWRVGLERMKASAFCRGQNERNWIADVGFFLRAGSLAKILEGKYDDNGTGKAGRRVGTRTFAAAAEQDGKFEGR